MAILPGASFHSSSPAMRRGFDWAVSQAMAYVHDNAPIGPVYEAALPGRAAFCMRDSAHQALGAQVMGRGECNLNIFSRFAKELTEARDFCSLWEICFDGSPCPADYTSDRDFWYNLPANFDVMDACMRMYHWTGDTGYLFPPHMEAFHHASTHEYVRKWDRDRDGILDRREADGRRGLATYDEGPDNPGYRCAADLMAAQVAAYRARARMCSFKGEHAFAADMAQKAQALQARFNEAWWNEKEGHFEGVQYPDGSFGGAYVGIQAVLLLYFGLADDPEKISKQLAYILRNDHRHCMEERTYVPETLWRYGMDDAARDIWLRMTGPDYPRREYPEVAFAAIGGIASGYMGISPDSVKGTVVTRSAVADGEWAELNRLPLWGGYIHLLHEGKVRSTLANHTGRELRWTARFPGGAEKTVVLPAGESAVLDG